MNCPDCGTEFHIKQFNGTDISHCTSCSGIILSEENCIKIAPELKAYASSPEKIQKFNNLPDSERYCPVCSERYKIIKYKEIELDFCPKCRGIWFDKNELDSLLAYLGKSNPGIGQKSGITQGSTGPGIGDTAVDVVVGILGGVVCGIFESIFD